MVQRKLIETAVIKSGFRTGDVFGRFDPLMLRAIDGISVLGAEPKDTRLRLPFNILIGPKPQPAAKLATLWWNNPDLQPRPTSKRWVLIVHNEENAPAMRQLAKQLAQAGKVFVQIVLEKSVLAGLVGG